MLDPLCRMSSDLSTHLAKKFQGPGFNPETARTCCVDTQLRNMLLSMVLSLLTL